MRRTRKRNGGGVWGFAHEHPWLFTLFVVPAVAGVVVAGFSALSPQPLPPALPPA